MPTLLSASLSSKNDMEQEYMSKVPYTNAIGSLVYAMVCMRPDISQAIRVLRKCMHDLGKEHWQDVKWILRYIFKTVDVRIMFRRYHDDGQWVVGLCDSDYVGDLDKHRSTKGYVFTLAKAPIIWKPTLQSTVALSTIEVEYMVGTEHVKVVIWMQVLLHELGGRQKKHVKVHCDS